MSECAHCWHETGELLTSNPPQHRLICCWCSATKNVRDLPEMEIRDSHGDYARQFNVKYRRRSAMDAENLPQSEITEQQVRQQLENIQKQRVLESAQKIRDLAEKLGVEIVGVPRLVEVAPGVTGIAADWGVRLKP